MNKNKIGKIFTLCLFISIMNAASFDCNKASSKLEKTICSNTELSLLDKEMLDVYRNTISNQNNETKKQIKEEQRYWIKNVQSKCKTITCLSTSYKNRIEELKMDGNIEELSRGLIMLIEEDSQNDILWVENTYLPEYQKALEVLGDRKLVYNYMKKRFPRMNEIIKNYDWQMSRLKMLSSKMALDYSKKVKIIFK